MNTLDNVYSMNVPDLVYVVYLVSGDLFIPRQTPGRCRVKPFFGLREIFLLPCQTIQPQGAPAHFVREVVGPAEFPLQGEVQDTSSREFLAKKHEYLAVTRLFAILKCPTLFSSIIPTCNITQVALLHKDVIAFLEVRTFIN